MANIKSLLPHRRPTIMIVLLLLLLGGFFAIYYYYYIPYNKQQLHHYGFRILNRLKANMLSRNGDLLQLYYNCLTYYSDKDTTLPDGGRLVARYRGAVQRPHVPDTGRLRLTAIAGDQFLYILPADTGPVYRAAILPAARFMHPVTSYRDELFEAFFLVHHQGDKGNIIYASGSIGMDQEIKADSLLKKGKDALFSQIIDLEIEGLRYKMFTYPMRMDGHQLTLCGLLKMSAYGKRLNSLPVSFIYQVVIVLLLLLISLPFMRIYLLGSNEQVNFSDLLSVAGAFFVGVTLVTVIIIHVLLLNGGYNRAAASLDSLSAQIDRSLRQELGQIRRQLHALDETLLQRVQRQPVALPDTMPVWKWQRGRSVRDTPLPFNYHDTVNGYYNFERVVWINDTGQQIYKVQPDSDYSFLITVKDRNYFRYFRDAGWQRPEEDSSIFIEPIKSWASGKFSVNVAMRSRLDSHVVVMITHMYSLMNTVLPAGYGFCLIDADGNVAVHSEAARSLKENFFEETGAGAARTIREAIKGRQAARIREAYCYGSKHTVLVHPLPELPFYLVTFYDNNYIVPVNMRILIFTLLCSGFTCLAVLLVFFLIRAQTLQYSTVQPLAAYFGWAVPRKRLAGLYVFGCAWMGAYLVLYFTVVFPFFTDYVRMVIALLTPLNMMVVMHLYHTQRRPGYTLALLAAYTLAVAYLLKVPEAPGSYQYWLFQLFIAVCAVLVWLGRAGAISTVRLQQALRRLVPEQRWQHLMGNPGYINAYAIFTLLLVLCFSALPVSVYTRFAHNHEIRQSVRKQQLFMAGRLVQRREAVSEVWLKHRKHPAAYYEQLQYGKGLYGIHNDRLSTRIDPAHKCGECNQPGGCRYFSERLYFRVSDAVGNRYYDPFNYPTLQQTADDSAWCWHGDMSTDTAIILNYRFQSDPLLKTDAAPGGRGLQMTSTLPEPFYFLNRTRNVINLVAGVLLLLTVLFFVVRHMALRLFLQRAVLIFAPQQQQPSAVLPDKSANPYRGEAAVLDTLRRQQLAYKQQWNLLKDREKLVLLDVAADGWMNYNNLQEIGSLLNKQLLAVTDGWFHIKEPAFRLFVLQQKHTEEEWQLRQRNPSTSLWQATRTPLLITVLAVMVFIFLTQQEVFNKLAAAIGAVSSLLLTAFRLFGSNKNAVIKEGP